MKTPRLLLVLVTLAATALAPAADQKAQSASSEKAKKAPEWADLFGDASLLVIWQSASAASERIAAAFAAKELTGIPDWAETIHLASHALQSQVKLDDAVRQANLVDAFRLLARIADDITVGAWAGDTAKTAEAYARAKIALAIAQRSLPKEITEGPSQAVRFAKKPQSDSGKK